MPFCDSLSETTKMCEGKICFSSGQGTCMGLDAQLVKMGITSSTRMGRLLVQLTALPLNTGGKSTSNDFSMQEI